MQAPIGQISQEEKEFLAESEKILGEIKFAMSKEVESLNLLQDFAKHRYQELREEAYGAIKSDVPALLDQMHNQISLASRAKPSGMPSEDSPYFGALSIEENGKSRWVLIGHTSFLSKYSNHPIIDWRTAPLAKIFFQYREGDAYEIKLPGRTSKGIVRRRHILTIYRGKLIQVIAPQGNFRLDQNQSWHKSKTQNAQFHGGQAVSVQGAFFGSGETGVPTPTIAALLDPDQYKILSESSEQPLLVIGQAGSGKTTVALHRLAVIHGRQPQKYPLESIAVIVPEKGLANLTKRLLRALSISQVSTKTFDQWAESQGRQLTTKLPIKLCEDTPYIVSRMKRHREMFTAVKLYIDSIKSSMLHRLANRFPNMADEISNFQFRENAPLTNFIDALRHSISRSNIKPLPGQDQRLDGFFSQEREYLRNLANDRKTLLTSESCLMPALAPIFGEKAVRELIRHGQLQNSSTSDRKFRDIDEDRRTALDGQDLDWGTPDEISATIDVEDFSILAEIAFQKFGSVRTERGTIQKFCHAVIDEAQEFSPTELKLLGHALADPASVTVAGDAFQNTDSSSHFINWQQTTDDLQIGDITSHQLMTSYRCPAPIAKIALEVLGPLAIQEFPAARDGLPVRCTRFDGIGQAILMICDELSDLQQREANCNIAVIAREEETARRFYQALSHLSDCRLVLDGEFPFRSGIDVTVSSQVKGLEFDYVVVPDADSKFYGSDDTARRTLHLACTRACHQLWLAAIGTPATIIPAHYFQHS